MVHRARDPAAVRQGGVEVTTTDMSAWNPRFLLYCAAGGEPRPKLTLARDGKRWPGGRMTGFTLWIDDRWRAWYAATGFDPKRAKCDKEHAAFDAWLARNLGEVEAP